MVSENKGGWRMEGIGVCARAESLARARVPYNPLRHMHTLRAADHLHIRLPYANLNCGREVSVLCSPNETIHAIINAAVVTIIQSRDDKLTVQPYCAVRLTTWILRHAFVATEVLFLEC